MGHLDAQIRQRRMAGIGREECLYRADDGSLGCIVRFQLIETPVGLNHIAERILQGDVLIGGESGGITVIGHIPQSDGIRMGMVLLEIIAAAGASLSDLVADIQQSVGPGYYERRDITLHRPIAMSETVRPVTGSRPGPLGGQSVADVSAVDGARYALSDDSWLLISASGTEPALRV